MARISIEDIRMQLMERNWKLISDTYQNLDTELIYECPEGHRVYGPWKTFRSKCECPECKKNILKNVNDKIYPKKINVKRILALDQASHKTGWSIFDNGQLVSYGVFEATGADDIDRFLAIKQWFMSMLMNWKPDKVGMEGIQFQTTSNGQRTMGVTVFETLARLQGILMVVCAEEAIPYEICHSNTWRSYCGVKGRTRTDRKRSMQQLVKQWYDISVTDDESDAIGLGKYLSEHYMKNIIVENWE